MKYFILILFVFNFYLIQSQVHPPPYFSILCKDLSINNKCLKNYKITTYTFIGFPSSEKSESPDYFVEENNGRTYIRIFTENPEETGYNNIKVGTVIRLTLKENKSNKKMDIYFRLCKAFMAGESIQLNSFSFMQGRFFFDTYKSGKKYLIKNWTNNTKRVNKIEDFCDDSGQFSFDLSDVENHRLSQKKLSRILN